MTRDDKTNCKCKAFAEKKKPHKKWRYLVEVTPTKSPRTQLDELPILEYLRLILENADVNAIRPKDCYKIRDELTRKHGSTYANRYLEKLSHLFTKAIEWGVRNDHPMKGKVLKNKLRPERRVPDDHEIEEALKVASPMIRCYVELKLLTGLRMSDMLSLKLSDILPDGIHVKPRKTSASSGKELIIAWDEDGVLSDVVSRIKSLPRPIASLWLFCTRRGQPYIKRNGPMRGFQSLWQRWMRKALSETELDQPFTERSLRTKVGSESESDQAAADRLAHTSTVITRRAYREKPTVVTPLIKK